MNVSVRAANPATLAFLGLLAFSSSAEAQWPQFRGPDGQGRSAAKGLPLVWSEMENVVWRTPLLGRGWCSPVVEGKQVWLTASVETPLTEEEMKKGRRRNFDLVIGTLSMRALCVDLDSGKLLHNIELMTDDLDFGHDSIPSEVPFASPTPVIEKGKLYCHFGAHGTACLDTATQKVLWTNRDLKVSRLNGSGASSTLCGDLLLVHCDAFSEESLALLDKKTGKLAWQKKRSGKKYEINGQLPRNYGTPMVVEVAGKPIILSPAADWLYAYDPASREEIWKLNYAIHGLELGYKGARGLPIIPRPVAGHGMIYMCTRFSHSELLAIRYDGQGEKKEPHIVWRIGQEFATRVDKHIPSPLLLGDEIYMVRDDGLARCLDAKTGKVHWTFQWAGKFAASPLAADGRIYFSNLDGLSTVIQPGTVFRQLAENDLKESIMASPAAVDGAIVIRTEKALYRLGAKPRKHEP